MDSPIKVKRTRNLNNQSICVFITFQIHKQTRFGEGLFVCGNLPELGNWNPQLSLRLQWNKGNIWKGVCSFPKDISKMLEFKFITSQWNISEDSKFEWQVGPNRTIDIKLLQAQSTYSTEWNRQLITLCLRVHTKNYQKNLYYVTGSIEELGGWKEKKKMQSIQVGFKNKVITLITGDPQSLSQPQISSFQVITFSVRRSIQNFNYYYSRWGETAQTESFPGRALDMYNKVADQEARIADIEYLGERIIVDQSFFDDLVLQKMTNQIYVASCLKNSAQFAKLRDKNITAIIHLQSTQESCSINSSRVKALCKQKGVFFKNWVVQNLRNTKFIDQAQEIITYIEKLVVEGHRVCLHCSRKILREGPIKIVYLTLLGGHNFLQAMQQVRKQVALSESGCKVAQDVVQLVSQKINRGKSVVYTN